jgi:hypothetical protein
MIFARKSRESICVAIIVLVAVGCACGAESGQSPAASAFCIDLNKYSTAKLTDSLNSPGSADRNVLDRFRELRSSPFLDLFARKLQHTVDLERNFQKNLPPLWKRGQVIFFDVSYVAA